MIFSLILYSKINKDRKEENWYIYDVYQFHEWYYGHKLNLEYEENDLMVHVPLLTDSVMNEAVGDVTEVTECNLDCVVT